MQIPPFAFRPRLLDALRGYSGEKFFKDFGAGLTVGIVALPLAMAFAIASGLSPEAGLWTSIIAGFLIALLGGSNVQIGGPAGAFIVIVYGIVERYGLANLLISTACAGVLLFLLGFFRLGTLVRFVPVTIVIGFTNGIAVLIAASQIKDALGLSIEKMPADFFAQIHAIGQHLDSFNPYALALAVACVGGLFLWPRLWVEESGLRRRLAKQTSVSAIKATSRVPGPIIALVTLTAVAYWWKLPVETIGTRFGGIPQHLPAFALPDFSWETVKRLVAPTFTIALLGAIESLLCARVADQLTEDLPRHDPNQELMAQGIANFVVPFFGGMPATGTIARTVTNLRAGATTPVAGIVHSLALLAVVLVAAPLALYVPLAVLAGVLLFVAWNMGEWSEFARMRRYTHHYRLTMLGTFFLTVVFDLTVAIQVGLVLACVLFVHRMSGLFRAQCVHTQGNASTWKLHGALFFGAIARMDAIQSAVQNGPPEPLVTLDALHLVALDVTGLDALRQLHKIIRARGGKLLIRDLQEQPLSLLERSGFARELGADSILPAAGAAQGASAI
ncbi:MAG: SulP family inorganic anion transporter [Burkholderiales bacterium]